MQQPLDEAFTLRVHEAPFPTTEAELLKLLERVVRLSGLQELRLSTRGVAITRYVRGDGPVLPDRPEPPQEVDLEFLLGNIEVDATPFVEGQHPYHALLDASDTLEKRGLVPICLVAHDEDILCAWLGLSQLPTSFFGIRFVLAKNTLLEDRVLLVGAKRMGADISEAVCALSIDMAVDYEG